MKCSVSRFSLFALLISLVIFYECDAIASNNYTHLIRYNTGEAVEELQERLEELGYTTSPDREGVFGHYTKIAVMSFQQDNGLKLTGTVNEETYKLLFSTSSESNSKTEKNKTQNKGIRFTYKQMVDTIDAVTVDGVKIFTGGYETKEKSVASTIYGDAIHKGVVLMYDFGTDKIAVLHLFDIDSKCGHSWKVNLKYIKDTFTIIGPVLESYLDYNNGDRIVVIMADIENEFFMEKMEYSPIIDSLDQEVGGLRNQYFSDLDSFNDAMDYWFNSDTGLK